MPDHAIKHQLSLLSEQYPALFAGLRQFLASNPSANIEQHQSPHAQIVPQGERHYLFNCGLADPVVEHLHNNNDQHLIQVFHSVEQFLQFLSEPAAAKLINNPNWSPWVILPDLFAEHCQTRTQQIHVANWPWALITGQPIINAPANSRGVYHTFSKWLFEQYSTRIQQTAAALEQQYNNHPHPHEILTDNKRPLRVLTIAHVNSSYQQFCARDIVSGLQANGVEANTLILQNVPHVQYDLLSTLHEYQPDILFCNGSGRADYSGLPKGITILSWDQDHVLSNNPKYLNARAPQDQLRVMVRDWMQSQHLTEHDSKNAGHLNLGTNAELYHVAPTNHTPKYDVLFVGNIYPFEHYRKLINFDSIPANLQNIYLSARDELQAFVQNAGADEPFVLPDIDNLLQTTFVNHGVTPPTNQPPQWEQMVYYFRYRIAHFVLREAYINALSEYKLGLFGRGWEQFPELKQHAQPPIKNGQPLVDTIHNSAINLHLHTWTVHHPRLYDTASAGGFLLVGRVPESHTLNEVFNVANMDANNTAELDSFGSIAELKQKINYYLNHAEERNAMGQRAAARVRRDHTMHARMKTLIGSLKDEPATRKLQQPAA